MVFTRYIWYCKRRIDIIVLFYIIESVSGGTVLLVSVHSTSMNYNDSDIYCHIFICTYIYIDNIKHSRM